MPDPIEENQLIVGFQIFFVLIHIYESIFFGNQIDSKGKQPDFANTMNVVFLIATVITVSNAGKLIVKTHQARPLPRTCKFFSTLSQS